MLPAEGGVPEWIHLLPAGTFSDTAGTKYRLGDAGPVIAASMTAGKLPLDENHSTQRAPEAGNASPARGWIVALENRADGMWARVEWNSSGIALMTDKAYRYISPVYKYDKNGNVTRILSAALTNNPGLPQLTALQTSGDKMDKVAICTALGLAETVDDGVVLTALQTAAQSGTALQTAQARIAELERSTVPVTEMVALQTRLQTLEAKGKTDAATAFVDTAIKAGKPIAATRD
jgi:phage I-like protein